ncbi:MAG: hypothetical protein L6N95_03535 [Candidatus Methylarchaceae archaeon HK01B]|nr:hypothetical protein [Candidatus Methylarchaceae archaeon HK01M]MCP8311818.1 hypothetical protein [Candidatus Methylarchaceae archaeon HK02M1]MCP8318882.1 hypothetical protein [Candidatus Methylarchaceae archaeon HK01B]
MNTKKDKVDHTPSNQERSPKIGCGRTIDGLRCGYMEKNIHKRRLFLGPSPLIDKLKRAESLGWKLIFKTTKVGRRGEFFYDVSLLCPECVKM